MTRATTANESKTFGLQNNGGRMSRIALIALRELSRESVGFSVALGDLLYIDDAGT